jgi:hypothetical protein
MSMKQTTANSKQQTEFHMISEVPTEKKRNP